MKKNSGLIGAVVCLACALLVCAVELSGCGTEQEAATARAARLKAADQKEASAATADQRATEKDSQVATLQAKATAVEQMIASLGSSLDATTKASLAAAKAQADQAAADARAAALEIRAAAADARANAKADREEVAAIDAERDKTIAGAGQPGAAETALGGFGNLLLPGAGGALIGALGMLKKGLSWRSLADRYAGKVAAGSRVVSSIEYLNEVEPAFAPLLEKWKTELDAHQGAAGRAFVDEVQAAYHAPTVIS